MISLVIWWHEEAQHFSCLNSTSLSLSALLVPYLEAFAMRMRHWAVNYKLCLWLSLPGSVEI